MAYSTHWGMERQQEDIVILFHLEASSLVRREPRASGPDCFLLHTEVSGLRAVALTTITPCICMCASRMRMREAVEALVNIAEVRKWWWSW
jgi:hypothetical protein